MGVTMLSLLRAEIERELFVRTYGRVQRVRRDAIRVFIPNVRVGALCHVETHAGNVPVEIVSLDPEGHVAMPLDDLGNVQLGDRVSVAEDTATIPVGEALLGRVVDSVCLPYEGEPLALGEREPLYGGALNPMERTLITQPLDLGVRSLNALLTTGK